MSLTSGIVAYSVTLRKATLKNHFVIRQRPTILNVRLLDARLDYAGNSRYVHQGTPTVKLPVFVESVQDVGPIFLAKDRFNCASVNVIHIHDMKEVLSKHLRHPRRETLL